MADLVERHARAGVLVVLVCALAAWWWGGWWHCVLTLAASWAAFVQGAVGGLRVERKRWRRAFRSASDLVR